MLRNEHRPAWTHATPLRLSISERQPLGYIVTDVPNASDEDGVSVSCSDGDEDEVSV